MPRFTQMMDVIFGLTGWVDFTNELNGVNREAEESELQDHDGIKDETTSIIE